jgi:iron complex transport system substrate-binding protein
LGGLYRGDDIVRLFFVKGLVRVLILIALCISLFGCDAPDVRQTGKNKVTSDKPRIVTLSPHLAELVDAVGATSLLVGVSAYTDYPEAAAQLPVVGDAFNLDQERLTLLEPDLLLAWDTGTPAHIIDELRSRGYRVEVVQTSGLPDVAAALRKIGMLTGHVEVAALAAEDFERKIRKLERQVVDPDPIRVFYQIDAHPLYTVNGSHYVSQLIELCGGQNIFVELNGLAPLISVEAVLQRDPEVILASTDAGPEAFFEWQRWSELAAIRYDNQFLMPANEIGRATPRLVVAAEAICSALEQGRRNRAIAGPA